MHVNGECGPHGLLMWIVRVCLWDVEAGRHRAWATKRALQLTQADAGG